MPGPKRTPEEIRASIEQNREALAGSLGKLRVEVTELTDWRSQLRRNQEQLIAGAAVTGFVLGGGIGGSFQLVFGRKARRQRRSAAKAQLAAA
jgi:hypothetical protein